MFKKFNGQSKPGIPGISGDAASPGICHIPFALITHLVRVNDKVSKIFYHIDQPGAAASVNPRMENRMKMKIAAFIVL